MSIATLREYKAILTRFRDSVGPMVPLEQITMADGARYIAGLRTAKSERTRKPLSAASINKHKRNLKSAFNIAVHQLGYLRVNPFLGLREDKLADQVLRCVSPAEYQALVEACGTRRERSLWWKAFLAVCYTAATRANEAAHLLWSDVDFEGDTLRVIAKPEIAGLEAWRPKDRDSRSVPIPSHTVDVLAQLQAEAPEGSEFVFVSRARAMWIRRRREAGEWSEDQAVINNLDRDFKRIARVAGVSDVSLHDLRRSCISHWARKLPAALVKELAGHSSIQTTLRYYVSIRQEDLAHAREVTAEALLVDPK